MNSIRVQIIECLMEVFEVETIEDLKKNELDGKLDMDSIQMVEFVVQLEEIFGFQFDDFFSLAHNMNSIDGVIEFMSAYIKNIRGECVV